MKTTNSRNHLYDDYMLDKNDGMLSGGDDNFDGDYYQARWDKTGVLEADCMLCHFPGYNFSERKKQITNLNFRWAPTAAAGFGLVTGSIQNDEPITVTYNKSIFDIDGKISPHIVRGPRDNACFACHAKPGWKKRGANFCSRTEKLLVDICLSSYCCCGRDFHAVQTAMDRFLDPDKLHDI